MEKNIYLYIAVMAGVSYMIRVLPLTLIRKPIKNQFIQSFLYYVPYVTLAVMTFPAILSATNSTVSAALALGIGIQNLPEGAAISLPLRQEGSSRGRAFLLGTLSGSVEPIFGILVVLVAAGVRPLMPWLLSFAAGAMLYVVVEELVPQAHSKAGTCGFVGGFLIMMILDVALG